MAMDPLGGTPPSVVPVAPAPGLVAKLGGSATLTTIVGALIAIAVGVTDAWVFGKLSYDQALIFGGLGALLGVNPASLLQKVP